jgi:hypothetical protein
MNVSGVGGPSAVPAPMPVVPAPSPTERAQTEAARPTPAAQEKKAEATKAQEEAAKLPPLKGLTLNEVRVMLGALPVSAAAKLATRQQPGAFDVYA